MTAWAARSHLGPRACPVCAKARKSRDEAPRRTQCRPPRVALFVTCLVDLFRPSVGFATVKLLEEAGCTVEVPRAQTCCGQPAYNRGDREGARGLARQVIEAFEGYDYVVAPSGSCAATIAKDYAGAVRRRPLGARRPQALAARRRTRSSRSSPTCWACERCRRALDAGVTYHDSCSGLRELGRQGAAAARCWRASRGWSCGRCASAEVCCGFGGTFCVKYPDISNVMVGDKTRDIAATGADMVLAGDLGCLMNMAGQGQAARGGPSRCATWSRCWRASSRRRRSASER